MNMRQAFVEAATELLDHDPKVVVLLGDISVHAFEAARRKHHLRVLNCGISEQAMVSMAAGLARSGFYPIVHTIAPFLVERAFEQLKIDFGYNGLRGCFVSVGASYDYNTMGPTHHCPGDVPLLLTIPGFEILLPATAEQAGIFVKSAAMTCRGPTYIRLAESEFAGAGPPIGRPTANVVTVAVGPTIGLPPVNTTVHHVLGLPLSDDLMVGATTTGRVLILEPFYEGTVAPLILKARPDKPLIVRSIGVPRKFIRTPASRPLLDEICGLTRENVAKQILALSEL